MKKWKISRLKVENFKPFEDVTFDFRTASMITLDGPNGFGKTSIFDALELLFTGEISRIKNTNDATVAKNSRQKQFSENIYWNRSKLGPISIKAELISDDNNESITLARTAEILELTTPANNAPDNFAIFKLYKASSLEPGALKEEISQTYLEKILGENFLKNFSILNYLEQGQNRYLYSKKANERRDGINHLINIDRISSEIKKCTTLEKIITDNYTGTEHENKKKQLENDLNKLKDKLAPPDDTIAYKRLTTAFPTPNWDLENPVLAEDEQDIEHLLNDVINVRKILENQDEILSRRNNASIDLFLQKEKDIKLALKIGSITGEYNTLKEKHLSILNLKNDIAILKKNATELTEANLDAIKTELELEEVKELILTRDAAQNLNSEADKKLVDLLQAHALLFEKHEIYNNFSDSKCAYCGIPWESKTILKDAIKLSAENFRDTITSTALELDKAVKNLHQLLTTHTIALEKKYDIKNTNFDSSLYQTLSDAEAKFSLLVDIIKQLKVYKITPNQNYIHDKTEIEIRFNQVKISIQAFRTPEKDILPENWLTIFKLFFTKEADISSITATDLDTKEKYLISEHAKLKNTEYKRTLDALVLARKKISSGKTVKAKVVKLRKALEVTEKKYAKKTISDIELLFHIYSGRLIQNYQRGLGLFISSGKGDVIRFNTADKSEHDAILSMSSGQIASLGMAFFLTLNRVYASNAFILIDDPVQSMDEINIASLSDLLRVELSDRQILLSNHETEVSTYMRYKFKRAGLTQASISMLK